jgi:hypothetical protein
MDLENKIISLLKKKASDIEQKIKAKETRVDTGTLKSSIKVEVKGNAIIFSAVNYGKFQDEGTYSRKRQTSISKTVWPQYIARGKGRKTTRGILPLHFTDPLKDINNTAILGEIKPYIMEEMTKEIKKQL